VTQFWKITDTNSGAVLYDAFRTPSFGSHPKDNGWDWDPDNHQASRIDPPGLAQTEIARLSKWSACKSRRSSAEEAGCQTPLGRVDTDADSQRKISGSVQMAMLAQAAGVPFSIDWTMEDDTAVTHDAQAMILMGMAVGQHVAACHAAGFLKREAIYAAQTVEEVGAIDLEEGWPV
jgi:hypothetical protein